MCNWPVQGDISPAPLATAPYNFVPLPESVVSAVNDASDLPDHDRYDLNRHTGHFEVRLTTRSPLYIRGMLTSQEFKWSKTDRDLNGREVNGQTSYRDRAKNKPDFFFVRDSNQPVLPGSSLRGMLRSVLEIVSYSKPQVPADKPIVYIRAVAATNDDALKRIYDEIMGGQGKNVRAGYLVKKGAGWAIHPAKLFPPQQGREIPYERIKEGSIALDPSSSLLPLSDDGYRPSNYPVSIAKKPFTNTQGRASFRLEVTSRQKDQGEAGWLICSGNMKETGGSTDRKRHTLILERDESVKPRQFLNISNQSVEDYRSSLTEFIKTYYDRENGCLIDGHPVFYVPPRDGESEVRFFGHSPNFRIPAGLVRSNLSNDRSPLRATTPRDFLPAQLYHPEHIDFAEALFGFVRTKENLKSMGETGLPVPAQGEKGRAYAGRVFITQGESEPKQDNLWLVPTPPHTLTPQILATPKPECFQHYLVQLSGNKSDLKHYGSNPGQDTVIRGHKRYWHQGAQEAQDVQAQRGSPQMNPDTGLPKETSTQHTLIKPLRSEVVFTFRVYFENLSLEELGALCWTLHPASQKEATGSPTYWHKLGMGKPLGMGAVELEADLVQTTRRTRYKSLFGPTSDGWEAGESATLESEEREVLSASELWQSAVNAFETKIKNHLGVPEGEDLADQPRIKALLRLMSRTGQPAANTRNMDVGEFKERKVLPEPNDTSFD